MRSQAPLLRRWACVAPLLALVLVACGDGAEVTSNSNLDGRTFLSDSVSEDGEPRPLVDGTQISLAFDDELGWSAGCNHFSGSYEIKVNVLKVGQIGGTEMACDEPLMAQDDWLSEFFLDAPTVAVDGDRLTLRTASTEIVFVDREVADPDRPLVGTRWTLDTLIDGDAASSVPEGVTAGIRFSDDGTFDLDTGCNQGGGSYRVAGAGISFSDLVTTKRACSSDTGTVEGAVLAVVEGDDLRYEIEASSLTITGRDNGLGFTAP